MEIWGLIFQWFLWVLLEALGIILVLGLNFPWNRPIFLRICPRKSFENWLFSAKIPRNGPIFLRIFTFLPWKSPEIGRLFREFWLFSREIGRFFREFAPENPAKFCFFSAKYQKAWYSVWEGKAFESSYIFRLWRNDISDTLTCPL